MAMRIELPFLMHDKDRYGNDRWYVRRRGRPKIRLRVEPDHPEFHAAYVAAREAIDNHVERDARIRADRASQTPGTIAWVASRYFASAEFKSEKLTDKSRKIKRSALEEMFREKFETGQERGRIPAKVLSPMHVQAWVDNKKAFPGAAENRKKFLSAMCNWAIKQNPPLMLYNPCRDTASARKKGTGHHTWTEAEVAQYEASHPIGTQARLAMALMLFLGIRISDAVRIGRQHYVKGAEHPSLRFTVYKTRKTRPMPSTKPVPPELAHILANSPVGDLHFLVNKRGKPWTDDHASDMMRKWCDEAGLPDCTAHGLRKAAACRAVLAGATAAQLVKIFDWASLEQADTYIKEVQGEALAAQAVHLLAGPGGTEGGHRWPHSGALG